MEEQHGHHDDHHDELDQRMVEMMDQRCEEEMKAEEELESPNWKEGRVGRDSAAGRRTHQFDQKDPCSQT